MSKASRQLLLQPASLFTHAFTIMHSYASDHRCHLVVTLIITVRRMHECYIPPLLQESDSHSYKHTYYIKHISKSHNKKTKFIQQSYVFHFQNNVSKSSRKSGDLVHYIISRSAACSILYSYIFTNYLTHTHINFIQNWPLI